MSFEIIWIPDANVRVLVVKKTQPKINDSLIPFSFHSPFFSFSEHTSNTFFTCFFSLFAFIAYTFQLNLFLFCRKDYNWNGVGNVNIFQRRKIKSEVSIEKANIDVNLLEFPKEKTKRDFFMLPTLKYVLADLKICFNFVVCFFYVFDSHLFSFKTTDLWKILSDSLGYEVRIHVFLNIFLPIHVPKWEHLEYSMQTNRIQSHLTA